MPDQYGEITLSDLEAFRDQVESEFEHLSRWMRKIQKRLILASFHRAQVLKHAEKGSLEEMLYGIGAIKVRIPRLSIEDKNNVWARPKREQGRLSVPPIESWTYVEWQEGFSNAPYYHGAEFLDNPIKFNDTEDNLEEIGFLPVDPSPLGRGARPPTTIGAHLSDLRDNPDKVRILESDSEFIFLKDGVNKLLRLMAAAGYEVHITSGANGKIFIGGYDPSAGTSPGTPSAKTDIEADAGAAGTIKLVTSAGTFDIETAAGKITIKSSGADIDVTAESGDVNVTAESGGVNIKAGSDDLESSVLGETLKAFMEDMFDELDDLIGELASHIHGTVFGPSSPPTNASSISSVGTNLTMMKSSDLPDILSSDVKNN